MLVLSRCRGEKIVVGKPGPEQVVIELVKIRGLRAMIGISADKSIPVHRSEVYDRAYPPDQPAEGGDDAA